MKRKETFTLQKHITMYANENTRKPTRRTTTTNNSNRPRTVQDNPYPDRSNQPPTSCYSNWDNADPLKAFRKGL